MNEENASDDEESGTNKSQRDGVLSTNRACGSLRMNEENLSDNEESGTNKSQLSTNRALRFATFF